MIVIGCGTMGSSACSHLARRGVSVIGIERFGKSHSHGSHGGYSRITRETYAEGPEYVRLAQESHKQFLAMQNEMQTHLIRRTDFLTLGPSSHELVQGVRTAGDLHKLPYTEYSRDAFMKMYPQFHLRENEVAIVDHTAGIVRPERSVRAFLDHAEKHGAKILYNTKVINWSESEDGVTVTLEDGTICTGEQLIITAGAFTSKVVADLGVKLKPTRQI